MIGEHRRCEPLPIFICPRSLLLGADAKERQDLQPRLAETPGPDQLEKTPAALLCPHAVGCFGDRDDRIDPGLGQIPKADHHSIPYAGATDRVVRLSIESVEADANVERAVAAIGHFPKPAADLLAEQHPVGEHGRRPLLQRRFEHRQQIAIHERFAPGEVIVADAESLRFSQPILDVGEGQHLVRVILRRAGDEAVRAGDVADRSGDLKPERIESQERNVRMLVHFGSESRIVSSC